jgi:hypothetical protein
VTDVEPFDNGAGDWTDCVLSMLANADGAAPTFDPARAASLGRAPHDNGTPLTAGHSYPGSASGLFTGAPGTSDRVVYTDPLGGQPEGNAGNDAARSAGKVVVRRDP